LMRARILYAYAHGETEEMGLCKLSAMFTLTHGLRALTLTHHPPKQLKHCIIFARISLQSLIAMMLGRSYHPMRP